MKDIIIMALEHEAPKMAKWENVFFTGVGKVNAALTAGKLIERYQPRTVWNLVQQVESNQILAYMK